MARQKGVKDKLALIGRHALVELGGLQVKVEILDYKFTYGRDRYLVAPLSGKGEVWVEKLEVVKE